mgnify:CR=1 FL=1
MPKCAAIIAARPYDRDQPHTPGEFIKSLDLLSGGRFELALGAGGFWDAIEAMGGRESFVERLDRLFDEGLYWHGNEPNHHIAYLYAYAGQPWKVERVMLRLSAAAGATNFLRSGLGTGEAVHIRISGEE